MVTEAQRQRNRHAALMSHAHYPPGVRTRQLREGMERKFLSEARELQPDAPEEELPRIAGLLRKAYFIRLSAKGVQARKAKAKP